MSKNLPKYLNKRTKMEIERDRKRISELAMLGYTYKQIADIIKQESGYELSQTQIGVDLRAVRDQWRKQSSDSYELHINRELDRLDALEQMLLEKLRDEAPDIYRRVVNYNATGDESGSSITTENNDRRFIAVVDRIMSVQAERRRLLGLYAPQRTNVNIHSTKVVKAYVGIDPDEWPSHDNGKAIEGEVVK